MSAYFIKNLDIARPDGAGTVSGGAIFTSENTSEQQKEDVYYSTLLAQLAADKKYSRTEQSQEWSAASTN
ncbi:hypothetical protein FRC12_015452 [Ceratobasidium sp. 428]|nr:hypothetical protein FRC12_015452 [Ceratobasidium sp. 428]